VLVNKNGDIIYSLFAAKVFSIDNEQYVITTIKDITEKFYAEQEVHKNKQYLETIFDSVNEAIFILDAANGKILDSNNKASEITGYSQDEFLKLSFDDISVNTYPYDRKSALRKFFGVVAGGKEMFEWLAKRKDGTVFWVEVNIKSVILDDQKRLILSARDISERKETESIIRKSEEQNRMLASSLLSSPLAMIYWSVRDDIISIVNINTTAEILLGYTKEDILDSNFINLFIDATHGDPNQSVADLLKNSLIPKNITKEVVTKTGGKKLVGWFNTIIFDQFSETYNVLSLGDDITQIHESERMIKESEERYKNLFDFSPEPIFVYKNNTIVFANTATAILLGHNYPDELVGNSIFDYVHPDSIEITKIRQKQMDVGEVKLPTIEQKYVRTDGKIIFVEVSSIPFIFKDIKAVQVVLRDITDRKNSESELRKLSSAVQQSPAAIVITDTKGIITYTNPKFSDITGYTFDEAIGKNVNFLNAGTQNGNYQNLWDRISSGKEWRGEFLNRKKSGEIYWEFASISPIKNQRGDTTGYLAIKEDITDRKKTEEALIESKLEAEEANKLKSSLLANVSHEFRTPLNGILGFAQLLAEEIPDHELADMAQKIARSGKRLMNTLNSVLMITELENNEYLISKNDTDLNLFCKQLSTQYQRLAAEKNLNFIIQLPDKTVMAILDESLLSRAINHIVENAFKYTFQGEVKITLEIKPVIDGRIKALIHISDTGIGIKKEDQQIIFREFKQLSEGFRRDYEGLGLGLSLSRRIINLIGGDIGVLSEVDKGSCFTITLNNDIYVLDDETENGNNELRVASDEINDAIERLTKTPSVLLIEDNQFNIEVVQKFLHKHAIVDFARDGFTGIEMATNKDYDVLLIDINLGKGIDGLQVLTELKKVEKFANIPMVAITGYASNVNRREFLAQGFTHYLAKPFERRDLLKLLGEIFNKNAN
jgi:PAS domain S-box-containing protein